MLMATSSPSTSVLSRSSLRTTTSAPVRLAAGFMVIVSLDSLGRREHMPLEPRRLAFEHIVAPGPRGGIDLGVFEQRRALPELPPLQPHRAEVEATVGLGHQGLHGLVAAQPDDVAVLALGGPAQQVEAAKRDRPGDRAAGQGDVVLVHALDGLVEVAAIVAEGGRGVAPKFQAREAGPGGRAAVGVKADHADVVAENLVAALLEVGGEGRLAGPGMSREG